MPKGQKIVDWTNAENDKKLLHAIIMASDLGVNYEKVAKAFGDGVPASCISLRISKIRKEVRGKGVTSTSTASIPAPSQRRPVHTASKAKTTPSKAINNVSDDTDDEIGSEQDPEDRTVQKRVKGGDKVITGRITKARKSPRQSSAKKDYQKMLDPFNDFGDGDAIFDRQGVTSEDSLDSDQDYKHREEGGASATGLNIDLGHSED
ncbi:MAG: hypothetical protein L6R38_004751 [Xanthoria sp. 2 TBL-2021]|nr:MAG: hypothetical protein L6R38_004751 [Xanthoria sp. 2 TBL-2021]